MESMLELEWESNFLSETSHLISVTFLSEASLECVMRSNTSTKIQVALGMDPKVCPISATKMTGYTRLFISLS